MPKWPSKASELGLDQYAPGDVVDITYYLNHKREDIVKEVESVNVEDDHWTVEIEFLDGSQMRRYAHNVGFVSASGHVSPVTMHSKNEEMSP